MLQKKPERTKDSSFRFFMRRSRQRKHAAEVAQGPHGGQRKINLPCTIARLPEK